MSQSSMSGFYRPLHNGLFVSNRNLLTSPLSLNRSLARVWCYSCSKSSNAPPPPATTEHKKEQTIGMAKVDVLKQKLELVGILCNESCVPGRYTNLLCPKCNGGRSMERSLSLHIVKNGDLAMWRCFRTDCNFGDQVHIEGRAAHNEVQKKFEYPGQMTEESLKLEQLGGKDTCILQRANDLCGNSS